MPVLKGAWAVLLALGAGNALYANSIGIQQAEFRHVYCLSANGRVAVENLYGDVSIIAWDRDEVLVEAIKRSPDSRRLGEAQIVVDSSADRVSIRTQYAGADAEQPTSVEYRITVPRMAILDDVKLINGGLAIRGLAGAVKASAVNGNIKAERLEGEADLATINGQLEADFNRISPSKPISLSSVNGPIRLSIPPGAGAILTALNLSGGIQSEFGRPWRAAGGHRLRALVHHGGTPIRLHNVNGGISILGRRAHPLT